MQCILNVSILTADNFNEQILHGIAASLQFKFKEVSYNEVRDSINKLKKSSSKEQFAWHYL